VVTNARHSRRRLGVAASLAVATVATSCSGQSTATPASTTERPTTSQASPTDLEALEAPVDEAGAGAGTAGIYAATTGDLDPSVADIPNRVYVPNSDAGTVSVIDPETFQVLDTFPVGNLPHHVVPSWDMQTLYVLDTAGNSLTPIDPRTAQPGSPIPVEDPYNLYFTPDGATTVVVAERYRRLDLRDPQTWELRASIPVPRRGVNHADFSEDGRYFYASCEFSGYVVKVDLVEQRVVAEAEVGIEPIDVKLSPDASVVFVADQARDGVMLLDPEDLNEVGFVPTGEGAHGLYLSRDATQLYVSNRKGGSVSVLDMGTREVAATWVIPDGGSPDMGGVSIDGSRLWLGGRYHGEVYVFDTTTGGLVERIPTGAGPHGLAVYSQPGRYSLGHTGVYR
jgi:YVTN family beta-propeller protein